MCSRSPAARLRGSNAGWRPAHSAKPAEPAKRRDNAAAARAVREKIAASGQLGMQMIAAVRDKVQARISTGTPNYCRPRATAAHRPMDAKVHTPAGARHATLWIAGAGPAAAALRWRTAVPAAA